MKNTLKALLATFLVVLMGQSAFGQAAPTRTTTASAIGAGSGNNILVVTSATGFVASGSSTQSFIYFADGSGEVAQVRSINGTNITLNRAVKGLATAHEALTPIYFGGNATFNPGTGNVGGGPGNPSVGAAAPLPAVFVNIDPKGQCTRASNQTLPVLNPANGNASDCLPNTTSATHMWVSYNLYPTGQTIPHKKLAVTQNTYTTTAVNMIVGVNTTTASTITLMACTGCEGAWYRIQDEANSSAIITIAGSSGQLVNGGATSPLMTTAVAYGGAFIYFDGSNWIISKQGQ